MTAGQRLVALFRKQRGLKLTTSENVSIHGRRRLVTNYHQPNDKDYAELARRIDTFAARIRRGAA